MKPASYRAGLHWIVNNDDNEWLKDKEKIPSVTACFLADLFGVDQERVVKDLLRYAKEAGHIPKRGKAKPQPAAACVTRTEKIAAAFAPALPEGVAALRTAAGQTIYLVGGVGFHTIAEALKYADEGRP